MQVPAMCSLLTEARHELCNNPNRGRSQQGKVVSRNGKLRDARRGSWTEETRCRSPIDRGMKETLVTFRFCVKIVIRALNYGWSNVVRMTLGTGNFRRGCCCGQLEWPWDGRQNITLGRQQCVSFRRHVLDVERPDGVPLLNNTCANIACITFTLTTSFMTLQQGRTAGTTTFWNRVAIG